MSKTLTSEESQKLAKELNIKPRTKAFADKLLQDPGISQTQAWIDTHKTNNPRAASVESSRTLAKPSLQIYMQNHINKAKTRIVDLVDSDKPDIALRASQDILDRTHGKATVIQENTTYTDIKITLGTEPLQVVDEQ